MKSRILLVDDDAQFIEDLSIFLGSQFEYIKANSIETGLSLLSENPDLVLLDVELDSRIDGITAIKKVKNIDPSVPIIMLTRHDEYRLVVQAMKNGASDYFVKSPETDKLRDLIIKTLSNQSLKEDIEYLKHELSSSTDKMVGSSNTMQNVNEKIFQAGQLDCPVLITGETGVGKELVSREIHKYSCKNNEPFVSVNISTINCNLFSSELFGHEKGSFTGAMQRKKGLFETARNGIIFLDEIGDLSLESQVKLLRVIDQNSIRRVGGLKDIKIFSRIVAATNRDLLSAVKDNAFRKDLYFRLRVFEIQVPPLRERKEDIPEIIEYFLNFQRKSIDIFTESAVDVLYNYNWPGNVRQLKNTIELMPPIIGKDSLDSSDVKKFLVDLSGKLDDDEFSVPEILLQQNYKTSREEVLNNFRTLYLKKLLKKSSGNISEAARISGLTRAALYKMMNGDDTSY